MVVLRYTLLRALVFAVVAALLWLAQLRGYMLVFVALLVSGLISVFVLRGSRDEVSVAWDRRLAAIKERSSAEDAWDDAQRELGAREAEDSGDASASEHSDTRREA